MRVSYLSDRIKDAENFAFMKKACQNIPDIVPGTYIFSFNSDNFEEILNFVRMAFKRTGLLPDSQAVVNGSRVQNEKYLQTLDILEFGTVTVSGKRLLMPVMN